MRRFRSISGGWNLSGDARSIPVDQPPAQGVGIPGGDQPPEQGVGIRAGDQLPGQGVGIRDSCQNWSWELLTSAARLPIQSEWHILEALEIPHKMVVVSASDVARSESWRSPARTVGRMCQMCPTHTQSKSAKKCPIALLAEKREQGGYPVPELTACGTYTKGVNTTFR